MEASAFMTSSRDRAAPLASHDDAAAAVQKRPRMQVSAAGLAKEGRTDCTPARLSSTQVRDDLVKQASQTRSVLQPTDSLINTTLSASITAPARYGSVNQQTASACTAKQRVTKQYPLTENSSRRAMLSASEALWMTDSRAEMMPM